MIYLRRTTAKVRAVQVREYVHGPKASSKVGFRETTGEQRLASKRVGTYDGVRVWSRVQTGKGI
jgi:hypothetical protein